MKTSKLLFVAMLFLALFAAPTLAMEHKIGLGVGSAPDYEGSEDSEAVPMLMLKGNYDSGRFFSLMGTNLKINAVPSKMFSFGPVLNYRLGRDNVSNNRVDDMDKIDGAFELGAFGGIDVENWLLGVEFLADVSGEHDGTLTQLSLGYRWKATPSLVIIPKVFATYADDDYMDTYFGVNPGNKGTSGFPNFKADGGFKDVGFNLYVDYTPWQNWGIAGVMGYSALQNDAKDSPLVDNVGDEDQVYFGLMGTYRWGN